MKIINEAGLNLIKSFENCSLEPYQDSGGVWSIGYGHTDGITENSAPLTQDQADAFLMHDLGEAEHLVDSFITAPLNDNQYAALVSLVYNCGTAPLKGHLGEYLNEGDYDNAAKEFLKWDHIDGVVSNGLSRRRQAEKQLFQSGI